jgi:hypothetical protein
MSSAKWTMSRIAAGPSMAGRGVADCRGVEAAGRPGEGAAVWPVADDGVVLAKVEESASGELGGGGEQQGPRTIKESAAVGHGPFTRHYVAEMAAFTRASERPSGSQDAGPWLIGLPRRGSYCYGVHIAGTILLVRKRVG